MSQSLRFRRSRHDQRSCRRLSPVSQGSLVPADHTYSVARRNRLEDGYFDCFGKLVEPIPVSFDHNVTYKIFSIPSSYWSHFPAVRGCMNQAKRANVVRLCDFQLAKNNLSLLDLDRQLWVCSTDSSSARSWNRMLCL